MTADAFAPHLFPDDIGQPAVVPPDVIPAYAPKRWLPRYVLLTKEAQSWPLARQIAERAALGNSEIIELKNNRLPKQPETAIRDMYVRAKSTLLVTISTPAQRKLQPIPPSADWQFHIARGCPAHCQYCYLAGSLDGPPLTRVYANLPEILDGLATYLGQGHITSHSSKRASEGTTFEASCYTDPLALEHLTGAVAETIGFFGAWNAPVQLRWTTKFDEVDGFLNINHQRRTRARFSVNAREITQRFEAGTASLDARLRALAKMAHAGYPVGLTIAPIMPIPGWQSAYAELFANVATHLGDIADLDLTAELITHRFTPGSKDVLTAWYPATKLEMDEDSRSRKFTKFGSVKYVYKPDVMRELRTTFEALIGQHLPKARILYWT